MSDGTRDQLFLAFRLASLEHYGAATEPLPFVADDILVHFDDERSQATLNLLGEFGKQDQVLLFTYSRSVRALAEPLVKAGVANIVDLNERPKLAPAGRHNLHRAASRKRIAMPVTKVFGRHQSTEWPPVLERQAPRPYIV